MEDAVQHLIRSGGGPPSPPAETTSSGYAAAARPAAGTPTPQAPSPTPPPAGGAASPAPPGLPAPPRLRLRRRPRASPAGGGGLSDSLRKNLRSEQMVQTQMGNEEEYAARLGAKGLRAVRVARDGNCLFACAQTWLSLVEPAAFAAQDPAYVRTLLRQQAVLRAANALAAGDAALTEHVDRVLSEALHGGGGNSDTTTRLMRDGLTKVIQGGGQLGTALSRQVYVQTMATDGVLPERAELEQLAHVLGAPIYVYYYVPQPPTPPPAGSRLAPSSELPAPSEKIVLAPGAPTLGNATVRARPLPLHLHLSPLTSTFTTSSTSTSATSPSSPPPPSGRGPRAASPPPPSRSPPLRPPPPRAAADGRRRLAAAAAASSDDRLSPRPSARRVT